MMARPLFQTTAWVCLAAVVVFSLGAPSLRPMTVLTHSLEHAAIFLLAGLAFGLGYPGRGARVIAALVLFAGAIEIAQLYAPGRHARLGDFIIMLAPPVRARPSHW